jgi:hypothetical protein
MERGRPWPEPIGSASSSSTSAYGRSRCAGLPIHCVATRTDQVVNRQCRASPEAASPPSAPGRPGRERPATSERPPVVAPMPRGVMGRCRYGLTDAERMSRTSASPRRLVYGQRLTPAPRAQFDSATIKQKRLLLRRYRSTCAPASNMTAVTPRLDRITKRPPTVLS